MVKPAVLSLALQQHPANTLMAITGGVLYRDSGDTQSLEIGKTIEKDGLEASIIALTGLAKTHPLVRYVAASYRTVALAA